MVLWQTLCLPCALIHQDMNFLMMKMKERDLHNNLEIQLFKLNSIYLKVKFIKKYDTYFGSEDFSDWSSVLKHLL